MRNILISQMPQRLQFNGCLCQTCLSALTSATGVAYLACGLCPEGGVHQQCRHQQTSSASSAPTATSSSPSYVQLIPSDTILVAYPTSSNFSQYYVPSGLGMYVQSTPPPTQAPPVQESAYSCTGCGLLMRKHDVANHVCQLPQAPLQTQIMNLSIDPQQVVITTNAPNSTTMAVPCVIDTPALKSVISSSDFNRSNEDSKTSAVSSSESRPTSFSSSSSNLPFQCDICKRRFKLNEELEKHSIEHEDKPYMCEVCSKAFRQRRNLARHTRTHSEVKPFACDTCGWAFRRKSNLAAHERIHSGSKPFTCDECGKSFRQRGSLSSHLRTHTKEKPHECIVCGDLFTRKGSLQRHIARFHPELQIEEDDLLHGDDPFGDALSEELN